MAVTRITIYNVWDIHDSILVRLLYFTLLSNIFPTTVFNLTWMKTLSIANFVALMFGLDIEENE